MAGILYLHRDGPLSPHYMRRIIFLCWVIGVLLLSLRANAKECSRGSAGITDGQGEIIDYRVNVDRGDEVGKLMSRDEFLTGIQMAAAAWNEQSSSGSFRYENESTANFLPRTKAMCNMLNREYSLISVKTRRSWGRNENTLAAVRRRCSGTQVHIVIFVDEELDRFVGLDRERKDSHDFVGEMVHEFGHVLGLGHLNDGNNQKAIMVKNYPNRSLGHTWLREIREWDLRCSVRTWGQRKLRGYIQGQVSSIFYPARHWTENIIVEASGYAGGETSLVGSATGKTIHSPFWIENINNTSRAFVVDANRHDFAFSSAVWNDWNSQERRAFFSRYEDRPALLDPHGWHTSREVHTAWSATDRGFADAKSVPLEYCHGMSDRDPMRCDWRLNPETQQVRSSHALSFAYSERNNTTLVAWVNTDNLTSRHDDQYGAPQGKYHIYISAGILDNALLPTPAVTRAVSSVSPGFACSPSQLNGLDCILVYADAGTGYGTIKVMKISLVSDDGFRLEIQENFNIAQPVGGFFARTTHRIAAWYQDGLFWFAYKPTRGFELHQTQVYNPAVDEWAYPHRAREQWGEHIPRDFGHHWGEYGVQGPSVGDFGRGAKALFFQR